MKLSANSEIKFANTAYECRVSLTVYVPPIQAYLTQGEELDPFLSAIFANDFRNAISNDFMYDTHLTSLRNLLNWIDRYIPAEAYGSYDKIDSWMKMPDSERRTLLEKSQMIYSEKQELIEAVTNPDPNLDIFEKIDDAFD